MRKEREAKNTFFLTKTAHTNERNLRGKHGKKKRPFCPRKGKKRVFFNGKKSFNPWPKDPPLSFRDCHRGGKPPRARILPVTMLPKDFPGKEKRIGVPGAGSERGKWGLWGGV